MGLFDFLKIQWEEQDSQPYTGHQAIILAHKDLPNLPSDSTEPRDSDDFWELWAPTPHYPYEVVHACNVNKTTGHVGVRSSGRYFR